MMWTITLVILSILCSTYSQDVNDLKAFTLTDSNFDELTQQGKWLLDFYAPWCPHCQRLGPNFHEAAKRSKLDNLQVKFGLIDCTVEKYVCSKFTIRGYPTIKYYVKGRSIEYEGGREEKDLYNFSKSLSEPEMIDINIIEEFTSKNSVSMLYFGEKNENYEVVKSIAQMFQAVGVKFAHAPSDLLSRYTENPTYPSLVLINDNTHKKNEIFSSKFDLNDVEKWVDERKFPIISKINENNWRTLTTSGKLVVISVLNPNKDNTKYLDLMKELSHKKERKYVFAWIDGVAHSSFINTFDLKLEELPSFIVFNGQKNIYYSNKSMEVSVDTVDAFLTSVENGKEEEKGPGSGYLAKLSIILNDIGDKLVEHPFLTVIFSVVFTLAFVILCIFLIPEPKTSEDKNNPDGKEKQD